MKTLEQFCRVCATIIKKGYKHKCSNSDALLKPFGINVDKDECEIHPSHYCRNCHSIAKRLEKVGGVAESALQAHIWSPHTDNQCEVCWMSSSLHSSGRKKKGTKKRGRPKGESGKAVANVLQKSAAESWKATQPLSLSRFLPPSTTTIFLSDFQCGICAHIVNRPVETPCRKLLCADCISTTLLADDHCEVEFACPSCKESHNLTAASFTPASQLTLKI